MKIHLTLMTLAALAFSQAAAQNNSILFPPPAGQKKCPPLQFKRFEVTSGVANHPVAQVVLPSGYKLVGGGGGRSGNPYYNPEGSREVPNWQYLTGAWPASANTWVVTSKDHMMQAPMSIKAVAIGLYDPENLYDVRIVSSTSPKPTSHPFGAVNLPEGYWLLGGGAKTNWKTAGSLLTDSHPTPNGWYAAAKDHQVAEPTTITVYAIGIRGMKCELSGESVVLSNPGQYHPVGTTVQVGQSALMGNKGTVTSAGGQAKWEKAGQMLTAIMPDADLKTVTSDTYIAFFRPTDASFISFYSPTINTAYLVVWREK